MTNTILSPEALSGKVISALNQPYCHLYPQVVPNGME